jgi:hypothetical protein
MGGARCAYCCVAADMVLARSCGGGGPVIVWVRPDGGPPKMLEKAASRWALLVLLTPGGPRAYSRPCWEWYWAMAIRVVCRASGGPSGPLAAAGAQASCNAGPSRSWVGVGVGRQLRFNGVGAPASWSAAAVVVEAAVVCGRGDTGLERAASPQPGQYDPGHKQCSSHAESFGLQCCGGDRAPHSVKCSGARTTLAFVPPQREPRTSRYTYSTI